MFVLNAATVIVLHVLVVVTMGRTARHIAAATRCGYGAGVGAEVAIYWLGYVLLVCTLALMGTLVAVTQ